VSVAPEARLRILVEALEWGATIDHVHGCCAFCERFSVEGHAADCRMGELAGLVRAGIVPVSLAPFVLVTDRHLTPIEVLTADDDLPDDVRREVMAAAIDKVISVHWLGDLWRRGWNAALAAMGGHDA